ncbi:MAG: formylglycine-generating enzyme family protein [bacterium]
MFSYYSKAFKYLLILLSLLGMKGIARAESSQAPPGMVFVPAGWFYMGSKNEEIKLAMEIFRNDEGMPAVESWFSDESPQHKVYLDAFYIDKYEVSNQEYKQFVNAGGYKNKNFWTEEGWNWLQEKKATEPDCWSYDDFNRPEQPVVCVSWYEAGAYARWAGKRLPSEAEWEKAARGDDHRIFPWGNKAPKRDSLYLANYHPGKNQAEDGYRFTAPAVSFSEGKSPYGAVNMAGNVWAWCSDWYGEKYYSFSPPKNPQGPDKGEKKIVRGGAWLNFSVSIRSAYRSYVSPQLRYSHIGIRCVRSASFLSK